MTTVAKLVALMKQMKKEDASVAVKMALTKERLIRFGFCDLALAYQSVYVNY